MLTAARIAVRGVSRGVLTPRSTGPYRQLPVVSHLCGAQQLCNGLTSLLCCEAVSAHADVCGLWRRAYSCSVLGGCKVCWSRFGSCLLVEIWHLTDNIRDG